MVSKEIHDFGLEDLKKEYEKLRQSYNLPEFSVLNEILFPLIGRVNAPCAPGVTVSSVMKVMP